MLAIAFLPTTARAGCVHIAVRAAADVGDAGVSLADLLTPETCPGLRQAGGAVWLGNAPQPGATRIFDGSEIRRAIHQLTQVMNLDASVGDADVPERVIVRRAGAKASCSEIEAFVFHALRQRTDSEPADRTADSWNISGELDCGRAGRVPRAAPLELIRVFWDPALRTWEYSLRCVHPSDCVPFLVRKIQVRQIQARQIQLQQDSNTAKPSALASTGFASLRERPEPAAPPVVRVGQAATLFWEQDGIRATVPVICLDHGAVGTLIRARTKNGNRILRAEVVSAGVLRAAL